MFSESSFLSLLGFRYVKSTENVSSQRKLSYQCEEMKAEIPEIFPLQWSLKLCWMAKLMDGMEEFYRQMGLYI